MMYLHEFRGLMRSCRFVKVADGSRYKNGFSFEVNSKPVTGLIGVLDFGQEVGRMPDYPSYIPRG